MIFSKPIRFRPGNTGRRCRGQYPSAMRNTVTRSRTPHEGYDCRRRTNKKKRHTRTGRVDHTKNNDGRRRIHATVAWIRHTASHFARIQSTADAVELTTQNGRLTSSRRETVQHQQERYHSTGGRSPKNRKKRRTTPRRTRLRDSRVARA